MINTSLLLFLFAGFSSEAPLQASKPNVLLIMADGSSNRFKIIWCESSKRKLNPNHHTPTAP
ncbi:hypothetical protein EBS67_18245 [bacterium]|nr:hypothetical protein [Gemmataceae bacterium]NBS91909.1 hypothetical protein [bacterium]NBT61835.1 hypothetical protein [Planctomycetia bacterium]